MANRYFFSRTDPVAIEQLMRDLQDALPGIIEGVADLVAISSQIGIDFSTTPSSGDLTTAQGIIDAHDGVDLIKEVYNNSETNANNIPGWAHWTESEAETWHTNNIETPLSDARTAIDGLATLNLTTFKAVINGLLDIMDSMSTMLWAMARMIIALRDRTWPNLSN